MTIKKTGALQIESSAFSQSLTFWYVQRVILIFLALFLIAVAFGLTGPGLLDSKIVGDKADPLWVQYDKFGRSNATIKLRIHVNTHADPIQLSISQDYLNNQYIKQISPAPIRAQVKDNKIIYSFLLEGPSTITFITEPQTAGRAKADIGLADKTLSISQFFFP